MALSMRARLAMSAAALAVGAAGTYVVAQASQPKERVIKVVASRFKYSPGNLKIKKGQPVVFELTTADVPMGFNLPDFNVRGDIMPGKVTRLRVVPDKTGTFVFLCDLFCGSGHEEMNGKLMVVD
jgi:cytochrome c oxidase subunit 2